MIESMKVTTWAVLIVGAFFLLFVGYQIVTFWQKKNEAQRDLQAIQEKVTAVRKDQRELQAQVDYLAHPRNLEKELRARFNYRGAQEKLMIIVPEKSTEPISD